MWSRDKHTHDSVLPVTNLSSFPVKKNKIVNPYSQERRAGKGWLWTFIIVNIVGFVVFTISNTILLSNTSNVASTTSQQNQTSSKEISLKTLSDGAQETEQKDEVAQEEDNTKNQHATGNIQRNNNANSPDDHDMEDKEADEGGEEENEFHELPGEIPEGKFVDEHGNEQLIKPTPDAKNQIEEDEEEVETTQILTPSIHFPSPDESPEMTENLIAWLKADAGVVITDPIECSTTGNLCEVQEWKSQSTGSTYVFKPASSIQKNAPIYVPLAQNGLPAVEFSCPMINEELRLHEHMTLFFIISPGALEIGDSYRGQKFFGNDPYGQFLFHGGKPAFFTSGGLVERTKEIKNGEFSLLSYRLLHEAIEIKANGQKWEPDIAEEGSIQVRISGNMELSLGHVKSVCDLEAFKGRIAEVLIYDTSLANDKVEKIEQYLQQKWWGKFFPGSDPRNKNTKIEEEKHREELITPETFDPENVFEWMPSDHILDTSQKRRMSPTLLSQWKKTVNEKVESIRTFQFGGDSLRNFIRNRKQELITLRNDLFGGGERKRRK